MSLLAALKLAAQQFLVFPLLDKRPCITGYKGAASRDPEQIERWWAQWPAANPAVLMGNGIFCVDADLKDDGPMALAQLQMQNAPFPLTRRVRTGGGGSHHLFWCPDSYRGTDGKSLFVNSISKIRIGIDIKTDGGYIVGAGSLHSSGKLYEWVDESVEIAEAPEWLLKLLVEMTPRATAPEVRSASEVHDLPLDAGLVDLIAPFWRPPNCHALALALGGFLGRAGYEIEVVEELIRDICDHIGNPNAELRCKDARDSYRKLENGGNVSGGPSIREITGADIYERICALVYAEPRAAEAKANAAIMALLMPETAASPPFVEAPPEKSVDMVTLRAALTRLNKRWTDESDERAVGLTSVLVGLPVEGKMLAKVVWMVGWTAPNHSVEVLDRHLLHKTLVALKLNDAQRAECVEYLTEQFLDGQGKRQSKTTEKQKAAHVRQATRTQYYAQHSQRKTSKE